MARENGTYAALPKPTVQELPGLPVKIRILSLPSPSVLTHQLEGLGSVDNKGVCRVVLQQALEIVERPDLGRVAGGGAGRKEALLRAVNGKNAPLAQIRGNETSA